VIKLPFADKRKQEREARKEAIIDAAEKLFFCKDYDDVSMEAIAKEVGVNKALLYYYFKDKETLFFAIVLRAARIFNEMMKKSILGKKTGMDKLGAIGWAFFYFYIDHPDYYNIYFYSGSPRFRLNNNVYTEEINALSVETILCPSEAVQEGIKDGTIREGLNPLEVAVFMGTVGESIVKLDPKKLSMLESQGIDHERFIKDTMMFLGIMVMNRGTRNESKS
jgi:AcrR family transcriptional regulator